MNSKFFFVALLSVASTAWAGPFEDGMAAYDRKDYATSLRIFRTMAAQGDTSAQYNLGVMYDNGRGVAQDYTEAVKWYRLAAAQGHASHAQYNLWPVDCHVAAGGVWLKTTQRL
jgi:TPR repeat protein